MSVSRIKYSKQYFPIVEYTADRANNVVNVIANNHLLFTGCKVFLTSDKQYSEVAGIALVSSANTFSVNTASPDVTNLTHFRVNGFLPGQTGAQTKLSIPRATGTESIIQSYVDGTGGASFITEVSLDGEHWAQISNTTHTLVSGDSGYVIVSPGWAYTRANLTSVGANTNLVFMLGE